MGRLILISGANGSGKSRFAEQLVSQTRGKRYYIATMAPQTEENHRRIQKHRQQRHGLGFQTLELPCRIGDAPISPAAVVLLEDVSNLMANVFFGSNATAGQVLDDICTLLDRCHLLVAVTISGLSPDGYAGDTAAYITALNDLNARLLSRADIAVTMSDGIYHLCKGDLRSVF